MKTDIFLKPQDVLPNGATVITCRNNTVLATWMKNKEQEYITWKMFRDEDGAVSCYCGNYFHDSIAALNNFNERAR